MTVVQRFETRRETATQTHADPLEDTNKQIDRLVRMDGDLYDDKLANEITKDKYQAKHTDIIEQLGKLRSKQTALESKVNNIDLLQRLTLLNLTQMVAERYQTRTIEQKRVILTNFFSSFTYSDDVVSVKCSKFASVIANKSLKTKKSWGCRNCVI
ncbi:hypothetical protein KDA11_00775 [Candidatus Saccharibacteria bacterium]|nr:hypothetical protein [Candidatus Saccharibacteria bacterium]